MSAMTIEHIQSRLRQVETKAREAWGEKSHPRATIFIHAGNVWGSVYGSPSPGRSVDGRGATVDEAIDDMLLKLDEYHPRMLALTLGVEYVAP